MKKKITKEIGEEIVSMYKSGLSSIKISKHFNINKKSILTHLNKIENYKPRGKRFYAKNKINNNDYFEKIDSEFKSYLLGIIMADGSLSEKNKVLRLRLAEHDRDIIDKICEEFGLSVYREKNNREGQQDCFGFSIHLTEKQYSDLCLHGVVPNKTVCRSFPKKIPENLVRHFIRGYFDGDGCITWSKVKGSNLNKYNLSFTSNLPMLKTLDSILPYHFSYTKRHPDSNSDVHTISMSSIGSILHFRDYIYKGSNIHINRKYEKLKEVSYARS